MSWASHPTTEMPSPPVSSGGRHRGPNRGAVLAVTVGLLLVVVALIAYLTPHDLFLSGPGTAAPVAPSPQATNPAAGPTNAPSAATPSAAEAPSPPAATSAGDPVSVADSPTLETTVFSLTNAERSKVGCPALTLNPQIAAAARAHSEEMARTGSFSHTGANGSDPGDRMRLAGYNARSGWAENIAYGQTTAAAVMSAWMDSSGHRANILNCGLTAVGIGTARAANGQRYWTQDFGIS